MGMGREAYELDFTKRRRMCYNLGPTDKQFFPFKPKNYGACSRLDDARIRWYNDPQPDEVDRCSF